MKIYKTCDYNEMSRKASDIISAQIILKPDSVIGLATGSTPIGIYDILSGKYRNKELDFSEVRTVNLDEYKGIDREDTHSYYSFMVDKLFGNINIKPENFYLPNGMEEDEEKECRRYSELIKELGGIDIQLLGLGHNGHIGFNEPGEAFEKDVHCVSLTKRTIEANKRFFKSIEDVPKKAYTMGIGSIMKAKKILLVVSGRDKAEILKDAVCGPITPKNPASILQLHNDLTVVADKDALSLF